MVRYPEATELLVCCLQQKKNDFSKALAAIDVLLGSQATVRQLEEVFPDMILLQNTGS